MFLMRAECVQQQIEKALATGKTARANTLQKLIPGLTDPDARTLSAQDAAHLTPEEVVELDAGGWELSGINCY